jgi:hypothetical protein
LSLKELADVANEGVWDRWSVKPGTILVEDFKRRDRVLED